MRERLAGEMNEAAEHLEYERAALFRDRIRRSPQFRGSKGSIRNRWTRPMSSPFTRKRAVLRRGVFYSRRQNLGNRAYFPRADRSLSLGEVLAPFLASFTRTGRRQGSSCCRTRPRIRDLLAAALAEKAGHKVEIATPRRGEKNEMVADAYKNAREALGRRLADSASQQKLLEGVGAAFGMETPPRRVEVYDNSHIMGAAAIGAMIVAGPEGFMKTHYRNFNIKIDPTSGDDYAMMREVLSRRFPVCSRRRGEAPERTPRCFRENPIWC